MNVRATASMSKKDGSVNADISKARISIEDGAE